MCVYAHQHLLHHNAKLLPTMKTYNNNGRNGIWRHLDLTLTGILSQLDVLKLLPVFWLLKYRNVPRCRDNPSRCRNLPKNMNFQIRWLRRKNDWIPDDLLAIYSAEGFFGPPLHFNMACELAKNRGLWTTVVSETIIVPLFRFGLVLLNWKAFLVFYLPWEFVINGVFRNWADYVDHAGAQLSDIKKNSASCYSLLFNLLTFNGGYHLEHHYRMGAHWTKIKAITPTLPPPETRQVSSWHYLGKLVRHHRRSNQDLCRQ